MKLILSPLHTEELFHPLFDFSTNVIYWEEIKQLPHGFLRKMDGVINNVQENI